MHKTFHKTFSYLLAAAVLLTSASCSKITREDSRTPISFSVGEGIHVSQTKAVTETVLSTLDAGFRVAAVKEDGSPLFNTDVAKRGGSFSVPGTDYYFPDGETLDFYAVYPSAAIDATAEGASFTFDGSAGTVDLVAAKRLDVAKQPGAVQLTFDHTLAQMTFSVKAPDDGLDYRLSALDLTVPKTGTYSFTDGSWTTSGTADIDVLEGAKTVGTSASSLTETVALLPGTVTMTVHWQCTKDGVTVADYVVPVEVTVERGKRTSVKMTLTNESAKKLYISTSIVDWVTVSSSINVTPDTV